MPLYGLVLAGGRSRRMQRDKAGLLYAGRTQLVRAMEMLEPLVGRCFVSARADQATDPQRAAFPIIADVLPDLGPIGGIHAALQTHPHCAWLVLACDLPFLTPSALRHLVASRHPGRIATAYRSRFDGQPEPLCAIYEPTSRSVVEAWIASGQHCPRALLARADVQLLAPIAGRALDNINTADEYASAVAELGDTEGAEPDPQPAAGARQLRVQYFAMLREQAGRSVEQLRTTARTPGELYAELARRHSLTLAPEFLRVAVNEQFGDWQQPLADGDTVVFLPPVAGG